MCSDIPEGMMLDYLGSQKHIGQAVQYIGKVPLGIASKLD